jgi:hypothetical protein
VPVPAETHRFFSGLPLSFVPADTHCSSSGLPLTSVPTETHCSSSGLPLSSVPAETHRSSRGLPLKAIKHLFPLQPAFLIGQVVIYSSWFQSCFNGDPAQITWCIFGTSYFHRTQSCRNQVPWVSRQHHVPAAYAVVHSNLLFSKYMACKRRRVFSARRGTEVCLLAPGALSYL